MTEPTSRNVAERTTLVGACFVLTVMVGLVLSQMWGPDKSPAPVATIVGDPRKVGNLHHVLVKVSNRGDETAAAVQVSAELAIDGESTTADQTIDFLARSEDEYLVFVFEDDPDQGALAITVSGFALP